MRFEVRDLAGRSAVADTDGSKILTKIQDSISRGEHVELDFSGVEIFASPFFNASIALLVRTMGEAQVRSLITISHISSLGESVLKSSIENAIETKDVSDQERLDDLLRMILEG